MESDVRVLTLGEAAMLGLDTATSTPSRPIDEPLRGIIGVTAKASLNDSAKNSESVARDGQGLRYNEGKLRYDLVPWKAFEDVVRVLTYGANKYAARNWERGMLWTNPYASMMRHQMAWWRGEETDPESGLPHMAHVAINALFLLHYSKWPDYAHMDDRPHKENQ